MATQAKKTTKNKRASKVSKTKKNQTAKKTKKVTKVAKRKSTTKTKKTRRAKKTKKNQTKFDQMKVFILMILAAFMGGSIPAFASVALEVMPSFTLLFFRFFIAYLILSPIVWYRGEASLKTFKSNFLPSFMAVMNPIILFYALAFTNSSVAILIYAAGPLMMALYLRVFQKRKFICDQKMGLLIGFVGVFLIVLDPLIALKMGESSVDITRMLIGNFMVLVAAGFFMLYGVFSKQQQGKKSTSPYSITYYSALIAMLIAVIPMIFIDFQSSEFIISAITWKHVGAVVWLGVVSTFLFFVVYQYVIKNSNEFTASLYAYLQPVSGVILSFIFFGEMITWLVVIGAILAIGGAKLASKNKKTRKYKKRKK